MTSLPIAPHSYDGQAYRITVLQHSSNLGALSGTAGQGMKGWDRWLSGLQNQEETMQKHNLSMQVDESC
jgi:hypothetical protein